MQDRLDGGISILMHCAGSEASETLSLEHFTVDLYIMPREHHETPEWIGGDLSALVQAFSEEFVILHLQRYAEHCRMEGIIPPRHSCPTKQFERDFEVSNKSLSAAVQMGQALANASPSKSKSDIRQHCNTDTFLLNAAQQDDHILPKLHQLIGSIRSSHWEAVLQSLKWNLTYEQASNLSRALNSDIHSNRAMPTYTKSSSSFLSQMFTFFGALVFISPITRKHVQALPTRRTRVTLSKEARTALTAWHRENVHHFRSALGDAWKGLDETVKEITSSHHKSFHCVQNDLCLGWGMMRFKRSKFNVWNTFCWKKQQDNQENGATGKDVLQELIKSHRVEYQELMDDEKAEILLEYSEHKETQATGIRISTKSKVNDVTQTLKAVENELNNLRSHTGAEAILYTTHGSMDLPLHGVAFATEGVDEFMVSVMNVNNQDLISKMEGFAVQGMKGAAKNHQKHCSDVHAAICHKIQKGLGWPANIPFINLSQASSALPDLEMICRKWESRAICWREIDDEEFQQLLEEHNEKLESGEIMDHHCRTHSDKGKKQAWSMDGSGRRKKTYKSMETIETDNEDETTPAANAGSFPSANIPSANISTNSTSTNTNDDAGTNTNASANSNVNAEASASTNFTNTKAFNNANAGTFDSFNPATFDMFRTPTPPAISSAPVSPSNEFFDSDALLAMLDTIFGPAAQI
ncbi:uncharacterized protein F5147DRAFT_652503 [Suillus discolor]|uniref:Uncharacterized protein n=1 Tax=Suillus discolor TaxID=1912936 RepID=A0A9P7F6X1_9AGAM|nr:uncharacterized protein F5147DRAFT_652503 [Suillus discolor]KAG2108907.1 hypothetical protein F5147DRAFT_652503 [Suillus discolor]